ncbi:helix-turn-helix transcriptional regulator [Kangiella sp. HZ709]|uniref:helix-turn-helix domain-containing protein n=1 Tax=Kangiella sp. HZ709 TaxID=2666328 RepID=UPI0012B09BF5|nr:helix-turn-helix transcriptional regulator [Kangiella sp. HZ709]MRX27863.1 helix-turn-helix domain-containing protein [Kangiella sp. HZ709]
MKILIHLDIEMAKNKMSLKELSQNIGISMTNLSLLKNGKVKAIRFSTLEAICKELKCQPGDILEYVTDDKDTNGVTDEE